MVILIRNGHAQRTQDRVNFSLVTGNKGPSGAGVELCCKVAQSLRSIGFRIDTNRYKLNGRRTRGQVLLHPAQGCSHRGTNAGASRKNKIDSDGLDFDEITIEVMQLAVLVVNASVGNLH